MTTTAIGKKGWGLGKNCYIKLDENNLNFIEIKSGKPLDSIAVKDIIGVSYSPKNLINGVFNINLVNKKTCMVVCDRKDQNDGFYALLNDINHKIDPEYGEKVSYVRSIGKEFNVLISNPGEIDNLPKIIKKNEKILFMAPGACEYKNYQSGHGLWVVTDKQLIFIDKGLIGDANWFKAPFDSIDLNKSYIEHSDKEIKLFVHGFGIVEIEHLASSNIMRLVEILNIVKQKPIEPIPSQQTGDVITQLERLTALKEKGALTDEEFAQEKKRILNL